MNIFIKFLLLLSTLKIALPLWSFLDLSFSCSLSMWRVPLPAWRSMSWWLSQEVLSKRRAEWVYAVSQWLCRMWRTWWRWVHLLWRLWICTSQQKVSVPLSARNVSGRSRVSRYGTYSPSFWIDKVMMHAISYTAAQNYYFFKYIFVISLLCSPSLHLIDQKNSNIVKYYYNLKLLLAVWIYSNM